MLVNTRRRVLGLIAGAIGAWHLLPPQRQALAAAKECYASKSFGQWKGVATNAQAGARISQIEFANPDGCDLRAEMQISTSYDAALVVYGSPDTTPLPKDFLIKPTNRLVVNDDAGKVVVDEQLCGVCNEIRDDKVTVILPLATAPLFRERPKVEIAVKLGDKEECRFTLNCEDLRNALSWASERREALAESYSDNKCTPPPEGCFLTTACCSVLGLSDDCFELAALRRYRDHVLCSTVDGQEEIALYYRVAPEILARMPDGKRAQRLLGVYLRFVLPSALAASLGLHRLCRSLYARMMADLAREFLPLGLDCGLRSRGATVKPKAPASPQSGRSGAPVAH